MADIRLSFSTAMRVLRSHVLDKLLKRGYSVQASTDLVFQINPNGDDEALLRTIFEELITECPGGKGISCSIGNDEHFIVGVN